MYSIVAFFRFYVHLVCTSDVRFGLTPSPPHQKSSDLARAPPSPLHMTSYTDGLDTGAISASFKFCQIIHIYRTAKKWGRERKKRNLNVFTESSTYVYEGFTEIENQDGNFTSFWVFDNKSNQALYFSCLFLYDIK